MQAHWRAVEREVRPFSAQALSRARREARMVWSWMEPLADGRVMETGHPDQDSVMLEFAKHVRSHAVDWVVRTPFEYWLRKGLSQDITLAWSVCTMPLVLYTATIHSRLPGQGQVASHGQVRYADYRTGLGPAVSGALMDIRAPDMGDVPARYKWSQVVGVPVWDTPVSTVLVPASGKQKPVCMRLEPMPILSADGRT